MRNGKTIRALVHKLGEYTTRKEGQELIFRCPKCARCKSAKLEINLTKGIFSCWRCKWSGRVSRLLGFETTTPAKTHLAERVANVDEIVRMTSVSIPIPMGTAPYVDFIHWKQHNNFLRGRGLSPEDVERTKVRVSWKWEFLNTVIFPIKENKAVVGYVARTILPNAVPKEIHSKGTPDLIYNYDEIEADTVVVVTEGIFDCEAVRRLGIPGLTPIAILGSNITQAQIGKILSKKPLHIVLLYDGDKAGTRGAKTALSHINKRRSNIATILRLPNGKDPDNTPAEQLRELIMKHVLPILWPSKYQPVLSSPVLLR